MNRETIKTLNDINQSFYRQTEEEFDQTRQHPWKGWERLFPRVQALNNLRLIDLGCGNGRFFRFLAGQGLSFAGIGIDSATGLLQRAERITQDLNIDLELRHLDIALEPSFELEAEYNLAVSFGVLHHLPGRETRRAVVKNLRDHTDLGGLIAISLWQLDHSPLFEKKTINWEEYNRTLDIPVDLGQLEAGDALIDWNHGVHGIRYCHFFEEEEILELKALPGLSLESDFLSDGKGNEMNRYLVFRRTSEKPAVTA